MKPKYEQLHIFSIRDFKEQLNENLNIMILTTDEIEGLPFNWDDSSSCFLFKGIGSGFIPEHERISILTFIKTKGEEGCLYIRSLLEYLYEINELIAGDYLITQ